jgi:hypothetical protein
MACTIQFPTTPNYFLVPVVQFEMRIKGDMRTKPKALREFAYEEALAVRRAMYRRDGSGRDTVVHVSDVRAGSIEFLLGIGLGATVSKMFDVIKDYPEFKKGAKEILKDVEQATRKVAKKFKRQ